MTTSAAITMEKSIPAQKSFHCSYNGCAKQDHAYTRQEGLDKHIISEHTSLRYPCLDCGKPFKRFGDLTTHLSAVHKGMKKYRCDPASSACGCGRLFSRQGNLNRHQRSRFQEETALLNRLVSDLDSDPFFKAQSAEILESYIENLQIPVLGNNQDELLARCAAGDANPRGDEIDALRCQPDDGGLALEDDSIDVALYQRLVRLFRSRRPRMLCDLVTETKAAIDEANIARFMRLIDPCPLHELTKKLFKTIEDPMSDVVSAFPSKLPIRVQGREVLVEVDQANIHVLLDLPGTGSMVPSEFAKRFLRWAAELLMIHKWLPAEPFLEVRKFKPRRVAETFYEAHYAASCVKSLSAGHTDSVDESVCPPREEKPDLDPQQRAAQNDPLGLPTRLEVLLPGIGDVFVRLPGSYPESEPLPPVLDLDLSYLTKR